MATNQGLSLFALLVALVSAVIIPNFTGVPLQFAAAPLIMLLYNAPLSLCIWMALFSGLWMDLLVFSPHFGFLGLVYLITCRGLFHFRLYFFKDSVLTLPIMTYLFSFFAQIAGQGISFLFDLQLPHIQPLGLICEPLCDVAFALVLFVLPSIFWQQYRQKVRRRRCESADS